MRLAVLTEAIDGLMMAKLVVMMRMEKFAISSPMALGFYIEAFWGLLANGNDACSFEGCSMGRGDGQAQ